MLAIEEAAVVTAAMAKDKESVKKIIRLAIGTHLKYWWLTCKKRKMRKEEMEMGKKEGVVLNRTAPCTIVIGAPLPADQYTLTPHLTLRSLAHRYPQATRSGLTSEVGIRLPYILTAACKNAPTYTEPSASLRGAVGTEDVHVRLTQP